MMSVIRKVESGTSFFTYLLRCSDGSFYCGWTVDLQQRLTAHNRGRGARYTRARLPVALVYYEEFNSRSEAQLREQQLKRLNHGQKSRLAEERHPNGF